VGWRPGIGDCRGGIREVETAQGNAEAEGHGARAGARVWRRGAGRHGGGNGCMGRGFLFDRQNTWGRRIRYAMGEGERAGNGDDYAGVYSGTVYAAGHEMVWGVGLGANRRDKLFWFAALDGTGATIRGWLR